VDTEQAGLENASDGARPRSRRGPRWWAVRGLLVVAFAGLGYALVGQWDDVADSIRSLTAVGLVTSSVVTVMAVGTTVLSWRAVLGGLGARLPLRAAVRIFFVGQVGKYIPGSVWPVLAQMELSRDFGVARAKAAGASLIVLALAVPCGGLAAAATLPFVSSQALSRYGWALAAVPAFAVLLSPPVLNRLLALAFRVLRREPVTEPLTVRVVVGGAGWLLLSFGMYGIATWLLVRDLDPGVGGIQLLWLSLGAYALAWTAGFLVVVLPAGAGVRELVLVLALSPALAAGPATLVAAVARLLATIADLVWAAIGMTLRQRRPVAPATDLASRAPSNPVASSASPTSGAGTARP
jgi:uncharacterized membrane protein YbhN (UPF0104 family)